MISLIFCNRWDEERYGRWTFRRDGDRIVVTPGAIDPPELPIALIARKIGDRRYATDAELRQALRAAPIVTLRGAITSAPIVR